MLSVQTIVIAGGKSSRMDYVDKLNLPLSGKTLLEIAIANAVGKTFLSTNLDRNFGEIKTVKDLVSDGGPAVGVWSCLQFVDAEYVLLIAADQPFISNYLSDLITKAISHHSGAWLKVDGELQPFASCVKSSLLYESLKDSQGVSESMKQILNTLDLAQISVKPKGVWDIDTWADYFYALGQVNEKSAMTEEWINTLSQQLDLSLDFLDQEEILDLTREVAHNIERKAAPLTTFLLGYLAGKKDLSKEEISKLISEIENTIQQIKDNSND